MAENTPPPSPGGESGHGKVDTEGIDDTIVVGVIQQLEKTGNRPHLLKELAAVLSNSISIVESSANPSAIISSRLATYLRRPWTALSRCPLAKVLIGTHPKRVYYYLTTSPHQPIPTGGLLPTTARIISPSLSSAASEEGIDDDDDNEAEAKPHARTRAQLSPSPELDLSSPDFEDASTPFPNRGPLMRTTTHPPTISNIAHNRRAVSPPLERDEREFTLTASELQQRRRSRDAEAIAAARRAAEEKAAMVAGADTAMGDEPVLAGVEEETEESAAIRNSEAAAALFGHVEPLGLGGHQAFGQSSPVLRAVGEARAFKGEDVRMGGEEESWGWGWSDLRSPENVELDELEDLFGEY